MTYSEFKKENTPLSNLLLELWYSGLVPLFPAMKFYEKYYNKEIKQNGKS